MTGKLLVLVIHNSDEIKEVVVDESYEGLLDKLLKIDDVLEDISTRMFDTDDLSKEEILKRFNDDKKHLMLLISEELYHDGDSEDGYTIIETDYERRVEF